MQKKNSTYLITGGARSGKSTFAEKLATSLSKSVLYIATCQPDDEEMRLRILAHSTRRPSIWQTVEEPYNLASHIETATKDQVILVDCITLWISNLLLANHDIKNFLNRLEKAIHASPATKIFVSNELGMGIVPDITNVRNFRDIHGACNQTLAQISDVCVFVVSGLPLILKGALPEHMMNTETREST